MHSVAGICGWEVPVHWKTPEKEVLKNRVWFLKSKVEGGFTWKMFLVSELNLQECLDSLKKKKNSGIQIV